MDVEEINEIKDAMEKSMAPGSQTFEQSLFKLFIDGDISQDEAMANADSATNMLWLINQATAGEMTQPGSGVPNTPNPDLTNTQNLFSSTTPGSDFTAIKIDMTT